MRIKEKTIQNIFVENNDFRAKLITDPNICASFTGLRLVASQKRASKVMKKS